MISCAITKAIVCASMKALEVVAARGSEIVADPEFRDVLAAEFVRVEDPELVFDNLAHTERAIKAVLGKVVERDVFNASNVWEKELQVC